MKFETFNALKSLISKCLGFAPYRISLSFALMLVNSVASGIGIALIVPLLASLGFDVGVSSSQVSGWFNSVFEYLGTKPDLQSVLVAYVVLISLVAAITYCNTVITASLQQAFVVHLRQEMSVALFYTQWRFLSQAHMPDFVRLLTGQVQSVASCLNLLTRLSSSVILVLVYIAFSFMLSIKLTLFALLCGVVLVAIVWPVNRHIYSSGRLSLTNSRGLYRSVFENLASLKIIKSFAAEEQYLDHLRQSSQAMEVQQVRLTKFSALTRFINMVGAAVIFSLLFFSSIQWLEVPVANLLIMLFIFSRLMPHVSSIQSTAQSLIHKVPSYQDLLERMSELKQWAEPKNGASSISMGESIVLDDVSYNYLDRSKPALSSVSATIMRNQTVAIVGESGSGKSTLVDLISGLLTPSAGAIRVDGVALNNEARQAWRRNVAYVTQDVFLFHDTVRANLSWICGAGPDQNEQALEQAIWEALESASASEFVKRLPNGLDTMIGDRGVKLSGGERQRLALARALLSRPQVLILDEATSALDKRNELRIRDALLNLDGTLTIIVIAHNDRTIEHVSNRIELPSASV